MEMAMLARVRARRVAMVVPLRAALGVEDVALRVMRPELDALDAAECRRDDTLARLGQGALARQSLARRLMALIGRHSRPDRPQMDASGADRSPRRICRW